MKAKFFSLVAAATVVGTSLMADAGLFKFEDKAAGDVLDKHAVYVYQVDDNDIPDTLAGVKFMKKNAKTQICKHPEMSKVVKDLGIEVQYIYVSDKRVAFISVDSCN